MTSMVVLAASVVTSGAAVTAAVETYRTRRAVDRQGRAVYGESGRDWDGLVTRSKRHEDRLDDHAEALREGDLL